MRRVTLAALPLLEIVSSLTSVKVRRETSKRLKNCESTAAARLHDPQEKQEEQ